MKVSNFDRATKFASRIEAIKAAETWIAAQGHADHIAESGEFEGGYLGEIWSVDVNHEFEFEGFVRVDEFGFIG